LLEASYRGEKVVRPYILLVSSMLIFAGANKKIKKYEKKLLPSASANGNA
jgi:hypothetical protein